MRVYSKALMKHTPEGKLPVYLASGLLGYSDRATFDALVDPLVHSGATSAIHFKERYIDRRVLSGEGLLKYVAQSSSRQRDETLTVHWIVCPDNALCMGELFLP